MNRALLINHLEEESKRLAAIESLNKKPVVIPVSTPIESEDTLPVVEEQVKVEQEDDLLVDAKKKPTIKSKTL